MGHIHAGKTLLPLLAACLMPTHRDGGGRASLDPCRLLLRWQAENPARRGGGWSARSRRIDRHTHTYGEREWERERERERENLRALVSGCGNGKWLVGPNCGLLYWQTIGDKGLTASPGDGLVQWVASGDGRAATTRDGSAYYRVEVANEHSR